MALPTFDGPAFAKWLRRWRDHEKLAWGEIASRSGIHTSTLNGLARGIPQKSARERGQTEMNPGITTLARLAHGLDLDLAYVIGKGGLAAGASDRWDAFSDIERTLLATALRSPSPSITGSWDTVREQLLHQLETTMTEEVTA